MDIKDHQHLVASFHFHFFPIFEPCFNFQSHDRGQTGPELGDVLSLVKMDGEVGTSLTCRAIAEMLMERCILEEAEGSERILAGPAEENIPFSILCTFLTGFIRFIPCKFHVIPL